jgi:hypothetical protein
MSQKKIVPNDVEILFLTMLYASLVDITGLLQAKPEKLSNFKNDEWEDECSSDDDNDDDNDKNNNSGKEYHAKKRRTVLYSKKNPININININSNQRNAARSLSGQLLSTLPWTLPMTSEKMFCNDMFFKTPTYVVAPPRIPPSNCSVFTPVLTLTPTPIPTPATVPILNSNPLVGSILMGGILSSSTSPSVSNCLPQVEFSPFYIQNHGYLIKLWNHDSQMITIKDLRWESSSSSSIDQEKSTQASQGQVYVILPHFHLGVNDEALNAHLQMMMQMDGHHTLEKLLCTVSYEDREIPMTIPLRN